MTTEVHIPKESLLKANPVSFEAKAKGTSVKGFLIVKDGKAYSYQNKCRHLPITLDLNNGDFLSADGSQIQCSMHGALYEIPSGMCVGGPCLGKSLFRFEVEEREDSFRVMIADHFFEGQ